jgi:uncharacterized protein YycO
MKLEPGDLLFVKTNHFVSKLIRYGQRGYGPRYAQWNHVAVYVGDGMIVEALTKGVVLSPLDKYPVLDTKQVRVATLIPGGIVTDGSSAAIAMRGNAADYARSCVGEKYGFATIAAIALKVLFKGHWNFGVQGTSICSGVAACELQRLGFNFNPNDPAELTPAYLAKEV